MLVSNDITVERIVDQESGVVGEVGTGNNAVAVANCEEPAIISDPVVDKNIAVETFLSEESSLSTCNVHVATEVPITYHSESSKLLESFNLSKDTMCAIETDSGNTYERARPSIEGSRVSFSRKKLC